MSMRIGYWRIHKYHRRKVKEDILGELGGFIGWNYMINLCRRADNKTAALIATTFETGGRITEVLGDKRIGVRGLTKKNFRPHPKNPDFVEVRGMEVLKLKEKIKGKWIRKIGYRNISIRKDEPLVPIMLNWVNQLEDSDDKLFTFGRNWAYKLLRKVDENIWCHWLRAQRACQLVEDYDFSIVELQKFFGWKRLATPLEYASISRRVLEDKMLKQETPFQLTAIIKPTQVSKTAEKKPRIVEWKKEEEPVVDIYGLLTEKKEEKSKRKKVKEKRKDEVDWRELLREVIE